MRHWLRWIIFALMVIGLVTPCPADEDARRFIAGIEAYHQGQYDTAIAQFNALAQSGLVNPKLFYNLANAYVKHGELGPAILWYERALRLAPDDPDLRFNLTYARTLAKDDPGMDNGSLMRIFFFWKYHLSTRTILILALGCNLLFWGLAAACRLTRRRSLRTAMWVALVFALIFVLTATFNYYEAARLRQAIVLPAQIAVRSGLDPQATQLFALHAGAKVAVMRELKDHCQIRFSEDKIGWVEKASIGII